MHKGQERDFDVFQHEYFTRTSRAGEVVRSMLRVNDIISGHLLLRWPRKARSIAPALTQ